jgi:hypothetical protein
LGRIWAIDIADQFPTAEVTATDLSPIQPKWVPPNLHFYVDDCETEWTFDHQFDFIHIRNLGGSIQNWPQLIARIYANLKPGGYLEAVDWETGSKTDDGTLPKDSAFQKWMDELNDAAVKFGREMRTAAKLKGWIEGAGFEDVNEEVNKVPVGTWPKDPKLKEVGGFAGALLEESLEPYSLALYTRVLGWSNEQLQVFLAAVRNDIRNRKYHCYTPL